MAQASRPSQSSPDMLHAHAGTQPGSRRLTDEEGWFVERRAGMRARIDSVRADALLFSTALDRMPQPVFICDADSRLLFRNAAATALLQRGEGLCAQDELLGAEHGDDDRALQRAILQAARMAGLGAVGAARSSIVVHRGHAAPLVAQVSPLPRDGSVDGSCGAALVVVIDPAQRRAPSPSLLHELFGLTPAEIRLAIAIAEEPQLSLARIAQSLGVAEPTVKSQLAAIFHKTGTNRRAELAGMLTRLSAL